MPRRGVFSQSPILDRSIYEHVIGASEDARLEISMIRIGFRIPLALALVVFLTTLKGTEAQDWPEEDAADLPGKDIEADNGDQAPEKPGPARDPFGVSVKMRSKVLLENGRTQGQPTTKAERLPSIVLRGYIRVKDRKPAALIEVDKENVYLVREAETLNIQWQNDVTVLKVKRIDEQSVSIELGASGRVLTVR